MDDDTAAVKMVNGRVEPDNCCFSYQIDKGAMVPVVWNLSPVFCGHCRKFKRCSRKFKRCSLQAVHQHIKSRHEKANEKHDMKVLRKTLREPVDTDGVSATIIHEKKNSDDGLTGESDSDDREGELEPNDTCFSYRIDKGAIVPVLWHIGPAFCAYCRDFKSRSIQAIYKHIHTKHGKESNAHERKVLLKTLKEPVDKEGVSATINHQKVEIEFPTATGEIDGKDGAAGAPREEEEEEEEEEEVHPEERKNKRKHEDVVI